MSEKPYNEPWSYTPDFAELYDAQNQTVMSGKGSSYDEATTARLLRRAAICVNACAGLPDFVVESVAARDLWGQQYRMGRLEELEQLVRRYMEMTPHEGDADEVALAICNALSDLEIVEDEDETGEVEQ